MRGAQGGEDVKHTPDCDALMVGRHTLMIAGLVSEGSMVTPHNLVSAGLATRGECHCRLSAAINRDDDITDAEAIALVSEHIKSAFERAEARRQAGDSA